MKIIFKSLILFMGLALSVNSALSYTLTNVELENIIKEKLAREIKSRINPEYELKIDISAIPFKQITTNDYTVPKVELTAQNRNIQTYSLRRVTVKDFKNNTLKVFPINVQTRVYGNVLTAIENIPYGSEINSKNTKLEKKEISGLLDKTLSYVPQNLSAVRNYTKGSIILSSSLKKKSAVTKNSTINIVFLSNKGLKIKLQGRALKEGAIGDTILVRSDKYNKTYNAVVKSSNEVIVRI